MNEKCDGSLSFRENISDQLKKIEGYFNRYDTLTVDEKICLFIDVHSFKSSCGFLNMTLSVMILSLYEEVLSYIKLTEITQEKTGALIELLKEIFKYISFQSFLNCTSEEKSDINRIYNAICLLINKAETDVVPAEYVFEFYTDSSESIAQSISAISRLGIINNILYQQSKAEITFSTYFDYESMCFALNAIHRGKLSIKKIYLDEMKNDQSDLVKQLSKIANKYMKIKSADDEIVNNKLLAVDEQLKHVLSSLKMASVSSFFSSFSERFTSLSRLKKHNLIIKYNDNDILLSKQTQSFILDPLLQIIRNFLAHSSQCSDLSSEHFLQCEILITTVSIDNKLRIEIYNKKGNLDLKSIRARAEELNYVKSDDVLSEQETANLIFKPHNSTRHSANLWGGRGVGMYSIKEKMHTRNGTAEVRNEHNGLKFSFDFEVKNNIDIMIGTSKTTCVVE